MTGPQHYLAAQRAIARAEEWTDADIGWKGKLTAEERLAYRTADLAVAQVHATLALAAATGVRDAEAWVEAASATGRR